jgi:hypothetical protein
MRLSYQHRLPLIVLVLFLFSAKILHGQANALSVPECSIKNANWVLFAASATNLYEYDQNSIEREDSTHFLIRIKETPKKVFYTQIKSEKMMEHRSLLDYQDRSRLIYDYEGYETYAMTITEEKIDGSLGRYTILEETDYDRMGTVLSAKKNGSDTVNWATSIGAVPETAAINLLMKAGTKSYIGVGIQPE